MADKVAKRWLIDGKVQGVSFRWFIREAGERLDLVGTVQNLYDGKVEVKACGAEASLEKLRAKLEKGPRMARVDEVAEQPLTDEETKELEEREIFEILL
ncbi:MAG: acylphosphatase [Acidobacteriota bacterium]